MGVAPRDTVYLQAPEQGTDLTQPQEVRAVAQGHWNKFHGAVEGLIAAGLVQHQAAALRGKRAVKGSDRDLQRALGRCTWMTCEVGTKRGSAE